jgi:hypothetical protein
MDDLHSLHREVGFGGILGSLCARILLALQALNQ